MAEFTIFALYRLSEGGGGNVSPELFPTEMNLIRNLISSTPGFFQSPAFRCNGHDATSTRNQRIVLNRCSGMKNLDSWISRIGNCNREPLIVSSRISTLEMSRL